MTSVKRQSFAPFIAQLTIFLSLFGLVPWYNFKQYTLFRPKVFRCYSSFLSFVMATLTIWLAVVRYQDLYNAQFSAEMICDIFLDLESLFTVSLVILGTAYWNAHTWANLYDLNSRTYISNESVVRNVFVLRHSKAILLLGHIFLIFIYIINLAVLNRMGHVAWYYFSSNFLLTYYEFLMSFAIVVVISSIKSRYILINRLFKACCSRSTDVVKNIKKVRKLCLYVDEIVDCFNQLFGWPLMLILFDFVSDILSALVMSTKSSYKWQDSVYSVGNDIIILNVGYLLQSGVWLTAIIFCCDSVVREADELLTNCYRLEQTLPLLSKELEELESLKSLIKSKRPKLTAAGFFEIRRSTLLSLLGTTTTYFIVALQFNSL